MTDILPCCGCDHPIPTDWCPRCYDTMGRYDPEAMPYSPPSRIARLLAQPLAKVEPQRRDEAA